eukprot:6660967-Lingulodinium_polyedra.AAC.1
MIGRDMDMKKAFNPCTTGYWDMVRQEYETLPDEAKAAYEKRSEDSGQEAKVNRLVMKHQAAARAVVAGVGQAANRPRLRADDGEFPTATQTQLLALEDDAAAQYDEVAASSSSASGACAACRQPGLQHPPVYITAN